MIWKVLLFIPLYCVWVMASLAGVFSVFSAGQPEGQITLPAVIIYLVVILIPVWGFAKWINATPGWMKTVQADGKEARATILSVKNSGMVINNTVAVVKLKLRVEPQNDAPFEVDQERQVSMLSGLGDLTAGAHVHVKYDPANKKHVVILSQSADSESYETRQNRHRPDPELESLAQLDAGNSGSDVARDLADLAKLHKDGDLSDSEFEAAKRKLLG